jgi:hexosaminidase
MKRSIGRLGVLAAVPSLVFACARGTPEAAAPLEVIPAQTAEFPVVPLPASITPMPGSLPLTALSRIAVSDPNDRELRDLAASTARSLRADAGLALSVASDPAGTTAAGTVALRLSADASPGPEGYRLVVSPSGVTIDASAHAGLFYGVQTLRQLLPADASPRDAARTIPAVTIVDEPRFSYRGMHLDVGRHLFPVAFIKRYIDLMAMYKMNTFHWHLTEDQGWRIEIAKYPRLTEVGSCRRETILEKNFDPYVGDGTPYCGYYTQDEIREIVAYAAERYVTVMPEIEMPGHSVAALAAYPELACTDGPFEVFTRWGVTEDIYCPKEETFGFLEDVLTEVMALFPSRYIHIGGDEAPKARWKESDVAQAVIRREGLADESALQSYFVRRIERFLSAHGRQLVGWDEILEGGLAPEATVMSWRGMEGGIEAARQGHDVIMTPGSHVYFDYYQGDPAFEPLAIGGFSPIDRVYAFEPVPEELTPEEARHVLGAQGNVWTEYMATSDYVEYMVFPRLLALSEVVWSPKDTRNWDGFAARLPAQFRRLDRYGVNYRVPHVMGLEEDRITLDDHVTVTLQALTDGTEIRYTLDGSDPTASAPRYAGPLALPVSPEGTVVTARAFLPGGRASAPRAATFRRTSLREPAPVRAESLAPGLRYAYYEPEVLRADSLVNRTPVTEGVANDVGILELARDEWIGFVFTGYLRIDRDGIYTFSLTSDDGSTLRIGDELVVDHDGPHSATTRRGMIALAAGYHPITVRFFQGGGGKELRVEIAAEGDEPAPLAGRLYHRR